LGDSVGFAGEESEGGSIEERS